MTLKEEFSAMVTISYQEQQLCEAILLPIKECNSHKQPCEHQTLTTQTSQVLNNIFLCLGIFSNRYKRSSANWRLRPRKQVHRHLYTPFSKGCTTDNWAVWKLRRGNWYLRKYLRGVLFILEVSHRSNPKDKKVFCIFHILHLKWGSILLAR